MLITTIPVWEVYCVKILNCSRPNFSINWHRITVEVSVGLLYNESVQSYAHFCISACMVYMSMWDRARSCVCLCWTVRKTMIHSWLTYLTPTEAHFSQQQASQTPTNTLFLSVIRTSNKILLLKCWSPIEELALPVGLCVISYKHSEAQVTIKVRNEPQSVSWFVNAGCQKPSDSQKWVYDQLKSQCRLGTFLNCGGINQGNSPINNSFVPFVYI